jgi:hypothetical protein
MISGLKPLVSIAGKESVNLKEFFAAAAMQALITGEPSDPDEVAKKAVEYANALLRALSEKS